MHTTGDSFIIHGVREEDGRWEWLKEGGLHVARSPNRLVMPGARCSSSSEKMEVRCGMSF